MLKGSNWVYKMVSSFLFPSHFEISKIDLVIDLFGIGILRNYTMFSGTYIIFWILKYKKKKPKYTYIYIYRKQDLDTVIKGK